MKYIGEDLQYQYFEDPFHGNPVRFMKDKLTDEVFIRMKDAMKAMGSNKTVDEFLGSDAGLDAISGWNKKYPDRPFFGNAVRRINITRTGLPLNHRQPLISSARFSARWIIPFHWRLYKL